MKKEIFLILFLLSFTLFFLDFSFNLKGKDSTFKVSSGANLLLLEPITSIKGKIIKDYGSHIEGESISFDDGFFEDCGNKINFTGRLSLGSSQKIFLDGGKKLKVEKGTVYQTISISGSDNQIEGVLFMLNDVELENSNTEVVFDIQKKLNSNIHLNSGKVILNGDLCFLDEKRIFGPGEIDFRGHRLSFGSYDLTWNEPIFFKNASDVNLNSNVTLNENWFFSGNSICVGNSNILSLTSTNALIVKPNSSLLLRDIILYGVAGNNIRCLNDNSSIILQNVKWMQSDDFSFTCGSLIFLDEVEFVGQGKTFIYESTMTSTIKDNATLILGSNFTFSYDPKTKNSDLLLFEADDSILFLDGASLYASYCGLNLKKGQMFSDKNSHIIIEERDYTYGVSGGVFIGNGDSNFDFKINVLNGSKLNIDRGTLFYRNINSYSVNFLSESSFLKVNQDAGLHLQYDLNIYPGQLLLHKDVSIEKDVGVIFEGGMHIFS